MKLPYRPYQVRRFGGEPLITVWRPTTYVFVYGPNGRARIRALVDCGADETLFPRRIADSLGIAVDEDRTGTIEGVGEPPIGVWPGKVEIEIARRGEGFRWPATVCFADENIALLGHLSCLEFFTVTLNYEGREFEFVPNSLYPGHPSAGNSD